MRVLIAGGSGLIGAQLQDDLRQKGHEVFILSRKESSDPSVIRWSVRDQKIYTDHSFDAVVNLAGAGIIDQSWTDEYKATIVNSRVDAVETLDRYFQEHEKLPGVYINASAIGIYGDHPSKIFDEEDEAPASDFLVIACEAWEKAVEEMTSRIDRNYIVRIGVVLSEKGGAFPRLSVGRPIGVVAYLGNGQQYLSWIHIEDLSRIFIHLIEQTPTPGIYNGVAPNPVTNKVMAKMIASTGLLGLTMPVPEFAIGTLLGQRKITVLNSARVSADKILQTNFGFRFEHLPEAIGDLLKKTARSGRRSI